MTPSADSPSPGLQSMTPGRNASRDGDISGEASPDQEESVGTSTGVTAPVEAGARQQSDEAETEEEKHEKERKLARHARHAISRQQAVLREDRERPGTKRLREQVAFPRQMLEDWESLWERHEISGLAWHTSIMHPGNAGPDPLAALHGAEVSGKLRRVYTNMTWILSMMDRLDSRSACVDEDLRALLSRARADIDAVPFADVKRETLTLYADACFLLALWQLFRPVEPAQRRKRRRSSDANVKRCRACRQVLPEMQIKVKRSVPGLCVPCNAEAIKFAKESGDDNVEPLVDMWALAEQWVEQHRSASPTPPVPTEPAEPAPSEPREPVDPSALIEIDEPSREKAIPRAFTAGSNPSDDPWISDAGNGARFIDAVKMLDLALIVAGGGDEKRREMIRKLDLELQRRVREAREETRDFEEFDWPRKEASRNPTPAEADVEKEGEGLTCARQEVPSIDPPSLQAYSSREAGRPFVLKGHASNNEQHPRWPAIDNWKRAGYLLRRTGRGRIVPVELGGNYTEAGWGQALVSWQQFLRQAGWEGPWEPEEDVTENDEAIARAMAEDGDNVEGEQCEALETFAPASKTPAATLEPSGPPTSEEEDARRNSVPVYLAQHSLFRQFPTLEADFSVPDYVYSSPDAQFIPDGVKYTAPPEPLVNVWIGSPGVLSPAHTDPYFNCYVQVLGRKRVWLAPPSVTEHMHAFGKEGEMDVDPEWVMIQKMRAGQDDEEGSEQWGEDEEDESLFASLMTNTSRLALLKPGQSVDTIAGKYPDFEKVLPHAMETVLESGDMLVLPPGWWHAMRQEGDGPGWSISFWY